MKPEDIIAAATLRPMTENPLVRGIVEGILPRRVVWLYAHRLSVMADRFPSRLALLFSICPDLATRGHLLENLIEEEGFAYDLQTGVLTPRPEKRHSTIARKLSSALADAAPLEPDAWSGEAAYVTDAISKRAWRRLAAFMMVGFEQNVAETFPLLVEPLKRHYGVLDDELEFITLHIAADAAHGFEGARHLAQGATLDSDIAEILEGAEQGGKHFWMLHSQSYRDGIKLTA